MFFKNSLQQLSLTAVRECGVCVRSTVDGAARIGDCLGAASCHNAEHSSDHGQHKNEARNGDGYGERAL